MVAAVRHDIAHIARKSDGSRHLKEVAAVARQLRRSHLREETRRVWGIGDEKHAVQTCAERYGSYSVEGGIE